MLPPSFTCMASDLALNSTWKPQSIPLGRFHVLCCHLQAPWRASKYHHIRGTSAATADQVIDLPSRWQGYSPSQCAQTSWYGPGLSEVLANAACITSEVLAAALALGGLGRPGDKLCLARHVAPFSGCWCRDHASRPGALITNEEPISMGLSNSLGVGADS